MSLSKPYNDPYSLRKYSFHVKVVEVEADPLVDITVEEVVALCVAGVEAGEVGGGQSAIESDGAVEHEGTWKSSMLGPRLYPEGCTSKDID